MLFYGLSSLTLREKEYQRLDVYERQVLRKMCKGWRRTTIGGRALWVPIANIKLYKDTGLLPLKSYIVGRRWQWVLHLARRAPTHPCRQIIESIINGEQRAETKRKLGGAKLTFLRQVAAEAKEVGIATGLSMLWRKLTKMSRKEHKQILAKICS